VNVHVGQGEREMIDDNKSLCRFELTGLPPAPRGMPQIEVTFELDANGILNVTAKDLGTGRKQAVVVTSGSGLNEDAIKRMVRDSESHREEDSMRKELAEARNELDGLLYTTERSLDEYGDAIPFEDLMRIREAIGKANEVVKGSSIDEIRGAHATLAEAAQTIAEALYAGALGDADEMAEGLIGEDGNYDESGLDDGGFEDFGDEAGDEF